MEITYTKIGDYYLPNIIAPQSKVRKNIGKYARLRLNHLKQNRKAEYIILHAEDKLYKHLLEVENECKERVKRLVNEMANKEKVDEKFKANNQLEWTKMMNNFKNTAEEIVLKELIFV